MRRDGAMLRAQGWVYHAERPHLTAQPRLSDWVTSWSPHPIPPARPTAGLADLVLDTFPYTAHTKVADAVWARGPPWLAMPAGDRFDSLLSSSAVHHLGAGSLRQHSLRQFEEVASSLLDAATFDPLLRAWRRFGS